MRRRSLHACDIQLVQSVIVHTVVRHQYFSLRNTHDMGLRIALWLYQALVQDFEWVVAVLLLLVAFGYYMKSCRPFYK